LAGVGVKAIVLPAEMKIILARVVAACKAAEAKVIRRREDTAATRSPLNTAKAMEGKAVALRMKGLETLERLAGRIDETPRSGVGTKSSTGSSSCAKRRGRLRRPPPRDWENQPWKQTTSTRTWAVACR
jgi:hypothetical protein